MKMKTQQTTSAGLLPRALKHGAILSTAILTTAAGAFAQEVAAWPFAADSGKPASAGSPVVSAESAPANEWPLTPVPEGTDSPLLYTESVFESASQYPLAVQFPNIHRDLRGYLQNPGFDSLVGRTSWRIDMEVSFESVAPFTLLQIGGTERGALRVMKQFKGGLRLTQMGHFDVKLEDIILEPQRPHKISLVKSGNTLEAEIDGQIFLVNSKAVAINSPGITIGGPSDVTYATPVGSISAIRIQSTETTD